MEGSVAPVQISANIILILSVTAVVVSEAETCSDLIHKTNKRLFGMFSKAHGFKHNTYRIVNV